MGVYIKDIIMPDNCSECRFESECGFCIAEPPNFCGETMDNRRPDWCPLIEVKVPHGKLIDGDKFYKVMCSHWVLSLGEAYKRLEEFLKKPVIEAEDEKY